MTNPVRPAADCRTMADVRPEIDRLDRAVVAILAERQSYIGRIRDICKLCAEAWTAQQGENA